MPESTPKGKLLAFIALAMLSTSCDRNQSVTGDPDSDTDSALDTDADAQPCIVDADCDDSDPCTSDTCLDNSCAHEPLDLDNDGYPASEVDGTTCGGTDCDDNDPTINPDAEEHPCSGRDDDCDGVMSTVEDADADGYPNDDCAPAGSAIDCNDDDDSVYPGAALLCDGLDHDCSGQPDRDEDGDGHYNVEICDGGDDCDDLRSDIYSGAPEVCLDGIDQDCDDLIDGPILLGASTAITDSISPDGDVLLTWTGSEFGVSWRGAYWARLDGEGTRIGDAVHLQAGCGYGDRDYEPTMSWTGSEFVLARMYSPSDEISNCDVYISRYDANGILVEGLINVTSTGNVRDRPYIAWTGSTFGLQYSQLLFKVISPTGVDMSGSITADGAGVPPQSIIWTGTRFVLIGTLFESILTMSVSEDGLHVTEGTELTRSSDGNISSGISAAWTGSEIGIAWADPRSSPTDIYFTRTTEHSEEVDDEIQLTYSGTSDNPTISWTGSGYGLVWVSGDDLRFALLNSNGEWTSDAYSLAETCCSDRSAMMIGLSWTGSEFGVAWRVGPHPYSLLFNRVGFCD